MGGPERRQDERYGRRSTDADVHRLVRLALVLLLLNIIQMLSAVTDLVGVLGSV